VKFAHLSDCHLGGWREPKLRDANTKAFIMAVDKILKENVDFVLIAGDLFNTAVPAIDSVRVAVEHLKRLKDSNVPVYFIAGSHDFSPSGKTMLDVLEHAGLAKNVARGGEENGKLKLEFTIDQKTGVKVAGMIGKKGGLEKEYYNLLDRESLQKEGGKKIFMFHSAVSELKPKELELMDAMPASLLPEGFDYYAAGHVHVVERGDVSGRKIVYPGPCFPNNFAELEKLKHGSFVLFDNGEAKHVALDPFPVVCLNIDASSKTPSEVEKFILSEVKKANVKNAIVTIRVAGCLSKGKPADVVWNDIFHELYHNGAYHVMRNTVALASKELEQIIIPHGSEGDMEDALLREHAGQFKLQEKDVAVVKNLMQTFSTEKLDGEKVADFESRVCSDAEKLFK
jgi:exonuclease SbcD